MGRRTYTGAADLALLQDFNAAAIAATDHRGYLHPGDISHHIYNGNRYYDPAEFMTIWEDDRGVAAWLLVAPRRRCYDAQVRPDLRGGDLEREVLERATERTAELMKKYDIPGDSVCGDAFRGEPARAELLGALGYEPDGDPPYVLNRLKIEPLDPPVLPEGYSIRSARGVEEATALAEVHNASFGSKWTTEEYRQAIEGPGYDPERELVVEAPDGSLAAFSIIWYDHLNRMGLFEPVGTHRDHRRRGLGQAIITHGLRQMAGAGMRFASVAHFGDNEAARGLYQSCGFKPWHLLDGYVKRISGYKQDRIQPEEL